MNTCSIYIFEAGSTKTDVIVYNGNTKVKLSLSGFNPNRADSNFSEELDKLNIPLEAEIHFYGSGINDRLNKQKVADLFHTKKITVNSDALGASRALLNRSEGIVCILGTGGNVLYYDGSEIIDNHGGYGYLIDDYGGGLELSKIIVSNWLNNNLSPESSKSITEYFSVSKLDFVSQFYQNVDLHRLAGVCKIIPKLALKDDYLSLVIKNYFDVFIDRHLYSMCKKHNNFKVNLVGSIALYYYDWIEKATVTKGIIINKTLTKPIDELLEFHLSNNDGL